MPPFSSWRPKKGFSHQKRIHVYWKVPKQTLYLNNEFIDQARVVLEGIDEFHWFLKISRQIIR